MKLCFNDVKGQSFVHMLHIICLLSPFCQADYQKGLYQNRRGHKIKSYDIKSHLECHCTLDTGLF